MFNGETGNVESFIDNLKITMVDIRSITKLSSQQCCSLLRTTYKGLGKRCTRLTKCLNKWTT